MTVRPLLHHHCVTTTMPLCWYAATEESVAMMIEIQLYIDHFLEARKMYTKSVTSSGIWYFW